jgi:FkbM family methyltransferase
MIHENPLISAFMGIPEFNWKNDLRYFLAFSPLVPSFVSDWSPIKGYEKHYQVKEGDVVVDAGAYPGDYTIFAAKRVGSSGHVIAFEPDERNRAVLVRNLAGRKLENVTIVPKGLWNLDTELGFDPGGFGSKVDSLGHGRATIPVTTLDLALTQLGIEKIDVLKMDIEGAEIQAVEGCRETLLRSDAFVCIASYHLVGGCDTSVRMEAFLRGVGYQTHTGHPRHLTTYGSRRSTGQDLESADVRISDLSAPGTRGSLAIHTTQ